MGIRSVLLLMVCISAFPAPQANAQFVTLEGRQFMVDGEEFYPRAMNYYMILASPHEPVTPQNVQSMYASPGRHYDMTVGSWIECDSEASCNTQLGDHFDKLVEMGFNSIRLIGLGPFMRKDGGRRYTLSVAHQITMTDWANTHVVDLPPDFDDPLYTRYFEVLRNVVSVANAHGIKVILLCADDASQHQDIQLVPTVDASAADDYAAYLTRLAYELKDEPGLMAYDLWNEPIWTTLDYSMVGLSKSVVCEYTTLWYDAIRASTQDHLVTLGGSGFQELGSWDPAVMKLDFYSPHYYPEPSEFDGYNMANNFERFKAMLYWTGAAVQMPWIVGETGFTAEDDDFCPQNTIINGISCHLDDDDDKDRMPYRYGNEGEQAAFAVLSMDATRQFLGSGYSWWELQNSRNSWLCSPTDPTWKPGHYGSNFWGVLKYGNDVTYTDPLLPPWTSVQNRWRDKLVVAELEEYELPPAPTGLPAPPPAYGNWHSLPTPVYRTYHLRDEHDAPVVHALAEAEWKYLPIDNPLDDPVSFWDQASSQSDGTVVFHKPLPIGGYNTPINPVQISVHASGAASHHVSGAWPDGTTLPFTRDLLEYAVTMTDIELVWDLGRDYKAGGELTVVDALIHDSGTEQMPVRFLARHFIHLTGEFRAGGGSEVRIHPKAIFPDCNSPWLGLLAPPPIVPPSIKGSGEELPVSGNLLLRFLTEPSALNAYPNPCMDRVTIEGLPEGPLTVFDAEGALVHRAAKRADQLVLDTSSWPPGGYRLRIETPEGPHTLSITKVR